jgi:hypothetical protein
VRIAIARCGAYSVTRVLGHALSEGWSGELRVGQAGAEVERLAAVAFRIWPASCLTIGCDPTAGRRTG